MRSVVSRLLLASLAIASATVVSLTAPASAAAGWTSVTSGDAHTCGIRAGRIYCWGDDTYGQLGDGTSGGFRATPAPIASGATDWTSVSAGNSHTCAVRAGRVACWGRDDEGQLGDGTVGPAADPTPGLIASGATDWKTITAGAYHSCAIRAGRVACWGHDGKGQLGDGTANAGPDPSPGFIVSGASDWTSVSAGHFHTCATRAGRIACWGLDDAGQLGDGIAGGSRPNPALIASGATDWKSVSTGGYHTCGIRAGRVACWGHDLDGELGDGIANAGPDPSPGFIKSAATDWTSVSAAQFHTCAIRAGRVACWGHDVYGQLGDGIAGGVRPNPALIASGATDWTKVEGGGYYTCAIRATLLACWGSDDSGQLGDGVVGSPDVDPSPGLVS